MIDQRSFDEDLKKQNLFFDKSVSCIRFYLEHINSLTKQISSLAAERNPHEFQFSKLDLQAEVITFTAATLDGVAAFISPFIDNLLTHPKACARIVAEIQEADRAGKLSPGVVMYDETTQLPFFMACIKETLRRDAPAQTILPRLVSQPGYDLYGGEVHVPAGTQMGASPYIIHRDEAVFGAESEKWKPERWIQQESGMGPKDHEEYVRRMEKYGMWWGYGDRECAGKYYAQMEMQKLCVELLRRFDIESPKTGRRFSHERWAVGMFWNQQLLFKARKAPVS
jgi:cytochrome P450